MKKILLFVISLMLLLSISSIPGVTADTQYGRISGTTSYTNNWGVYPLPFTRVSIGITYTLSNPYGGYALDNVPLDSYTITASKCGYESVSFNIELTPESSFATVNFILERSGDGGDSYIVKSFQTVDNMNVVLYEVHLQKVITS